MKEDSPPLPANPYAAPAVTEVSVAERLNFAEISTKALKTLRSDSHTIRAMAGLIILGLVFILIGAVDALASGGGFGAPEFAILALIGGWNTVVLTGLITRQPWGRVVGLISGGLILLGFPIGTVIGVFFLIALSRSKRLFGADRYLHKDLEKEWKHRKRNGVA